MWDKLTRKAIFLSVYNLLFWESLDSNLEQNAQTKLNPHSLPESNQDLVVALDIDFEKVPKDFIANQLDIFVEKQDFFEDQLKHLLSNWDQTYRIVKAILFTFLLENEVTELATHPEATGKYLRLAQDFANSQSVSVVHAVVAKYLESKKS